MSISAELAAELAERFFQAERSVRPIEPFYAQYPELTEDDAYVIQRELLRLKQAAGSSLVGYKIGATNAAAMKNFGLSQAVYARLLGETQLPDGATRSVQGLSHPRLECEVAFRMGSDLSGPGVDAEAALAAVEAAFPAFELVDSRTAGWGAKMPEMIGDNVFAAGFVLGATGVTPAGLDFANIPMKLLKNGELAAEANSANVLGSPLKALVWLANRIAEHGEALRAGDIVLAGSLTPLIPVSAGDSFEASFGLLGRVRVAFTQ